MRSWPSNNLLSHPLSVPVLLVAVILAVYYPALYCGIHPIDDPGIFSYYSASQPLSNILMPGNGYYYRPIVELSFYLDNLLWGMEPRTMHLENILLHCANSLLVYFLAGKILRKRDNETRLLIMLAAMLFALHPVNVEPVTWIAGRTDTLLAFFALTATYFLLSWLEKPRWQEMAAVLSFFAIALLTKETAFAFGAVLPLIIMTWPGAATNQERMKAVGILLVPGVLLVVSALVFWRGTSGLSRFVFNTDIQVTDGVWQACIAFGFYFKKFIVPFPLNFAIVSVHPLYGLLGLVLLPALWLLFRRYRQSGILCISAVLFILPAILVAVKQIAWTAFAERYLYLSTAFFILGLVGIADTCKKRFSAAVLTSFVVVFFVFGLCSFQRNLLWKDKLSFFQDAVAKSPEFGSVYYSLGGELMKNGEINRAAAAFDAADRLNKRDSMYYSIKAGIMGTLLARGEYLESRKFFFSLFKNKQDAPADFLELLYLADIKRLEKSGKNENRLLAHDLLETLDLLSQKKPDPFWLYQSGKISLIVGDEVKSADFFRRSYSAAPVDAHYRSAAQTYLKRLGRAK